MAKQYDYFLICPVRNASDEQKQLLLETIKKVERNGWTVYYPAQDTNQNDSIGYRICQDNLQAIKDSRVILLFYDKSSQGCLFDLGMAFALGKEIVIVNHVEPTETKSFANMVLKWAGLWEDDK